MMGQIVLEYATAFISGNVMRDFLWNGLKMCFQKLNKTILNNDPDSCGTVCSICEVKVITDAGKYLRLYSFWKE